MVNDFAKLIVKQEINPISLEPYVSKVIWDGDKSAVLRVEDKFDVRIDFQHIFRLLPFPVQEIEYSCDHEYLYQYSRYFVRGDSPFPLFYHRFMNDWNSILRLWNFLKQRIIFTFVVWGIGWVDSGQIIDWYCLGQKRPWSRR